MRLLLSLTFVVLGLYSSSTYGQQYNFKVYTPKNGLGSSTVNCGFQDSRGDLWFGTQSGGVSQFNGTSFKSYTKSNGLIGNDVTCITEDLVGNIWIGTSEGVSRFDGRSFSNFNDSTGLSVNKGIYSILVDEEGIIWFGSRGGGLIKYDGETFQSFGKDDGLPSDNVYSIAQTEDKRIWLACSKGVASFDRENFKTYKVSEGKTYFCVVATRNNDVWFGGTPGNGVLKYENGKLSEVTLPNQVKDDFIGGIAEGIQGRMWLATDHGLLKYSNGEFQLFTKEMGLSTNQVRFVFSDREGNVWIGTKDGGVNLLSNEAFVNYTEEHGLSQTDVNALTIDHANQRLFIGTARGGINILPLDGKVRFETIENIPLLNEISIYALTYDNQQQLWVCAQEGLFVLKETDGTFSLANQITEVKGNRLNEVSRIIQNGTNDYWVSSYGAGLIRMQGDSLTVFNKENGFFSNNVVTIDLDEEGNLWIGTTDAGVIKYDGSSFTSLINTFSFPDPSVWAITQDNDGVMYFGTSEHGLCRFDGTELKTYDMMFGSFTNRVQSLHWSAASSYLWIGTPEGIHKARFDIEGNIIEMHTYSENDRLLTFEIDQNAIDIDDNGTVWFGAANGITVYNPKNDKESLNAPQLRLETMLLSYEPVDWSNYSDSVDPFSGIPINLELNHKNNHLTFEVKAITTDKVSYSFKLVGQDEHWSPYSSNASAQYPNISPGEYTFMAKAINSNRVETESEYSYSFVIRPPWWSMWYVQAGGVLALIIIVIAIIKGREKVLREQNRLLEQTVAERTEEVVKEKKQVEKLYNRSEELLLNILPEETAAELKAKGHVEAELIDEVTVLFTDFKGFTALSEVLAPKELVRDIHECFSEFDRIMEKHGVEKIKTIGDAYMAAGGLPRPNSTHAIDVVNAAQEMVEFVEHGKITKKLKGLPFFEVRVGVHTGPVVAGIVGIKKFQYDIWGDTVNTASRMESSGEPGKVNISETTYQLVKDKFNCTYRGKVAAKGKGELEMYFVESARTDG